MSWTSEQLSELRAYAAEHRVVDSDCAMSLIAEVERLRAERQWQPMETAPRDGALILLWNGYGVLIGFWGQGSERWLGSASIHNPDLGEVKNWMPLPKPPEQKP